MIADAGGLTLLQMRLISAVASQPSRQMAAVDLPAALGVSPSAVSKVVDQLAGDGMLSRMDDPANRRKLLVTATPAGLAAVRGFAAALTASTKPRRGERLPASAEGIS